jgi:hypothetical protein
MRKKDYTSMTLDRQLRHKKRMKLYFQKYRIKNRDRVNEISRLSRAKAKVRCFKAYGGCHCCWCGEQDMIVLTIDHINNDGDIHRRKINSVWIYSWLKKHNYPKGFQILCFNCNYAKTQNNGVLPENRKNKYANLQNKRPAKIMNGVP